MLTKGAIGNLVNKYRAVLKKCRLLNLFGTLALTGALTVGAAGMAGAAPTWGPDQDVTITGNETLSNGGQAQSLAIGGAGNSLTVSSNTGHLYVSGATTLNDGGTLTLNTGPHGLLGTTDSASEAADTWTGSFGMTGGTLEISKSQLQMDAVTISGGTANIAGQIGGGTNWDDGAMLVGGLNGAATTVSGGKITVGDYGQVMGGQVTVSGGEVALGGNSGKAAILRSYGADNALTLTGNGKISVSASGYGVLTANAVNINGGTLDVKGNLTLAGALTKKQNLANALKASGDATVNQTGGTVAVAAGGALNINRGVEYRVSDSGKLSNAGTVTLTEGSSLRLKDGGVLTGVSGTSKFVVEDADTSNDIHTNLRFSSENFKEAQKGQIQINGGFVMADGAGSIAASKLVKAASSAGEIGFGSPSNLYVEQLTLTGADTLGNNLDASTGGLTSDTLEIQTTSGTSTVTNLSLVLTGNNSRLNVTGGSGDGTLLLNNASTALLIGADPQLYGGTQTATINAAVTLANQGMLHVGDAQTGSVATATFTKDVTLANGSLVVAEGSTMNLDSGATLDVQTGSANLSGTLNVDGTLKSASAGDGSTTGINVLQNGVLSAASAKLMKNSTTIADNLNKIWLDNGGTLRVTGLNTISTVDMQTYKTALVAGGTGLINYGTATVTVSDADKGSTENSIKGTAAEATGALLDGKTVEYDASSGATINGGYGADALVLNKATGDIPSQTVSGDLTLLGDAEGNLISAQKTGGTAVQVVEVAVAANKNLNLGSAGAVSKGGTLDSNVSLDNGSALNAAAAEYTVGDITAAADGNGTVTASAGATLTAGAIGDASGNAVASVKANNGILNADSIATKALTADNGIVKATGSITVANAVTGLNNGLVYSTTGDVTLTAGASNASGAIVADEGNITATGQSILADAGESLTLSAEKGTIAAQNVTATNVQAKTLTATGNVAVSGGVLIATGTGADTSSVDGTLNLSDATARVGDLDVTGAATIEGGSFTGNAVTLSGGGEISNGAQVTVDTLTGAGQTIKVGSDTDTVATSLTVNTLDMAGGKLFIDPAWTSGSNVVAVSSFDSGDIDVLAGVGQNSMLLIGSADANWLTSQVNAATNGAGLTRNGVDSVLGIYSSQTLDNTNGGIQVDGTKTNSGVTSLSPAANTADFSGKSLLVVNADAATGGNVALTATGGTLKLTDGAKLRIAGAKIGADYTVVDGFTTTNYLKSDGTTPTTEADSTAWVGANLSTDSKLVHLEKSATGEYKGALTSAAAFMPKLDGELVKVVNNMALAGNTGAAGEMSETKGVRFLNRAISPNYLNNDAAAAVTIESAARMALVGAVPQMTMAASNAAGNAVTQRTGLAQPGGNAIQSMGTDGSMQTGASAGDAAKTGFAMWIMPLYQSSNGFGMKAGNFDMDFSGGLGGVAIGADYTFDNAIRAGITFNIGGGYAQGSGDLNETTNNMNFWGIGAYAGWTPGNFGLTADVNYTSTYNKLEQDLPASMQMGKLKSDVTAYAISAGLRGEYKIETSVMDITPHVGVRYMSLNTDEYDVKSGGTLLKGDAINQNIWTFPVGVAFSKQIETGNGWHFKPSLDLAVIPAAGDIDARSDVRFTGTGTKAELDTQTMDYVSYMGQAGLEFGNDTTSLGVNYNIQLGAKSTAHGVFGTFRYEF